MQTNIYLPNVELNMEGVVVARWLVRPDDFVAAGQPLLEVETQKATVEVPCPATGHLRVQYVKAGDEVGERALLGVLTDSAAERFSDPRSPGAASASVPAALATDEPLNPLPAGAIVRPGGIVPAAPAARKLARELNLDLADLEGTGPEGRVTVHDVQAAANAPPSGAGGWEQLPASRLALIAQMQKSLSEIPQINITRRIDVSRLVIKQTGVTFTHRLVQAAAAALKAHPALRTIIVDNRIRTEPVSVAVAMETPHGLVAPALRQADALSLEQIAAAISDFQARGQANALRRDELVNAPFAITNLGMLEVDWFTPLVFHGQTAVLAVGRAAEAAAGVSLAWFTLAVDHRVVDGAEAARFLGTLQQAIAG